MRHAQVFLALSLFAVGCGDAIGTEGDGTWEVHHIEQSGGLLSVWGSGPDDVWVAGGQEGRGLILHGDGVHWNRVDVEADGLLWWIYGFSATDIYAVGEAGLIVHYDGVSWTKVASGTERTLYGVWGASGGDVWIVGGDPGASGVILRGQGQSFEIVSDVPGDLMPEVLYKIYGFHGRDVIAVGSSGTVLRFDGDAWEREPVPTAEPIFSLWGRGKSDLYAVGGQGAGVLLHHDGDSWDAVGGEGYGFGLSGVFTEEAHPTIAVGVGAYVVELHPDGTEVEPPLPDLSPIPSLHGVWGDGSGTAYAVGHDVVRQAEAMGGVIYRRHVARP